MDLTYSFSSIAKRFGVSVIWCIGAGFLAGIINKSDSLTLPQKLLEIMDEQSAPKSFHLISVLVMISFGIAVNRFGRQAEPSRVRIFFCYRPAEIALAFNAVFIGLRIGFGIGLIQWKIIFGALVAFTFSGALLLCMLWLSFPARWTTNEIHASRYALFLAVSGILIFYCDYYK